MIIKLALTLTIVELWCVFVLKPFSFFILCVFVSQNNNNNNNNNNRIVISDYLFSYYFYLFHKDNQVVELFISPDEANTLKPKVVCIICTGSQGEPLAALSRIADLEHKHIKLRPDDVVIFSSSPIPGNALSISKTINKLYLQGVKVYTNTTNFNIHTSGHLLMPKYMLPFHGEYRMLKSHGDLAMMCGVSKDNIFILDNGDTLILNIG